MVARLLLVLLVSVRLLAQPVQGGAIPVPLPLFPQNNWWNIDVSNAPVDLNSTNYINFMGGASRQVHPDFGAEDLENAGYVYGIPFIVVDGSQAKLIVDFIDEDVREECDGVDHNTNQPFAFYPVPAEAQTQTGWVEAGPPGNVDLRDDSDRHILIVDKTNNHLYELYNVWWNGAQWEAYSGAFFNMNTNNRRPDTWTSGDAAGLAILPGLVRHDEVYGPDEIRHAFRFTTQPTDDAYVYPASHEAGSTAGAPPMGMRLRLKDIDISMHPPEMQKIFRAMKKYGLILADNGSDMYVTGTYDPNWDNDVLNPAFHSLKASDFEVIQLGWHPAITFILTLPDVMGAGQAVNATLTAYDANYNVATGYTGTVHFSSTDGAAILPSNYTFTGADAGTHTFSFTLNTQGMQSVTVEDVVTETNTLTRGVAVGPPAPTNLVATATSTTSVNVSWSASAGATQYEVSRNGGTPVAVGSTNYIDNTVSPGVTYLYKVRAVNASSVRSPYTAPDPATTILFTDDPLVIASTKIKAVHVTQLRTAVNAMRTAAGLSAASFTDPSPTGLAVKAVHVNELRTALNVARTTLGLSAIVFTDPTLVAQATQVKKAHVEELRSGVR